MERRLALATGSTIALATMLSANAASSEFGQTIQADPSDFVVLGSNGSGIAPGDNWLLDHVVGDTGLGDPNLGRRAVLKFPLSLFSGWRWTTATLNLSIVESRKDGIIDSTPPFANPGLGDTIVTHIADYGTPDATDYQSPSIGHDPGVLVGSAVEPTRQVSVDITAAVKQAIEDGRSDVTFRLQSVIETDADGRLDAWFMDSANHPDATRRPYVRINSCEGAVAFEFAGVIDSVTGSSGPIAVGDRFYGKVWWEATVEPGSGQTGLGVTYGPWWPMGGAEVTVETASGAVQFPQDPAQLRSVTVRNDYELPESGQLIDQIWWEGNPHSPNVRILLRDSTHTALGGLGLPSELDLAAFDQTAVTVFQGTEALASGPLTSLGRVTAPNQMPCAWLAHVAGSEGSSILLNVTVHDADPGDTLNFSWSYYVPDDRDYGSDCTLTNGDTAAASIRCTDDGDYGLGVFVSDGKARYLVGNTLTLSNVAPTVSLATPVDGALFELNALVTADVMFNDPGTNDTHNCVLNWGDGVTTYDGPCLQVNDLPGQSHEYREAGVYTIAATVTDDDGGIGDASKMVVVYDPSAGYVSGEGWISSPAGAYKPTPEMTGKASFGFVSKYRKGASVPDGNTQFVFQAGDLNFHSNAYEWLVVSGSSKAQFKGVGTVNGHTNYGFLLSVTDAADNPKVKDAFRIKIWDRSMGDAVVYDNGIEQPLGGGNIVIRTGYVKK